MIFEIQYINIKILKCLPPFNIGVVAKDWRKYLTKKRLGTKNVEGLRGQKVKSNNKPSSLNRMFGDKDKRLSRISEYERCCWKGGGK